MARGRFINKKVAQDYRLNNLPEWVECLFLKMIPHLDCEGRMHGSARLVNSIAVPLRGYLDEQVEEALNLLESSLKSGRSLIERYTIDGIQYLWMPGFEGEQRSRGGISWKLRESPSEIPPPPAKSVEKVKAKPRSPEVEPHPVEEILDSKLATMATYYEEHIGKIATPSDVEKLKDFCDTYPEGWFEKAVDEAVAHGARSFRYVEKILERWQVETPTISPSIEKAATEGVNVEE